MPFDPYSLSSYQYELPEELIAQRPLIPRDSSRLMIVDRKSGNFSEIVFKELADFLEKGDSLVFNDTKVIPSRLIGKKPTGGEAEIFLLRRLHEKRWEVLAKPGKKLKEMAEVIFNDRFRCRIIEILDDGRRIVDFQYEGDFDSLLQEHGALPLPPYIERKAGPDTQDKERYQTVYAKNPGALAAPTAGLHFTEELLNALSEKGVDKTTVTLHVGLGTFKPVQAEDIRSHLMHEESGHITRQAADKLNQRGQNKKQICIGTTSCRILESAADEEGKIQPGDYETKIFIYPGYRFRYVQHLLTNFHLPGSTLLMLVSAFAGRDLILEAYRKAVLERYRFFSYGDAMLII